MVSERWRKKISIATQLVCVLFLIFCKQALGNTIEVVQSNIESLTDEVYWVNRDTAIFRGIRGFGQQLFVWKPGEKSSVAHVANKLDDVIKMHKKYYICAENNIVYIASIDTGIIYRFRFNTQELDIDSEPYYHESIPIKIRQNNFFWRLQCKYLYTENSLFKYETISGKYITFSSDASHAILPTLLRGTLHFGGSSSENIIMGVFDPFSTKYIRYNDSFIVVDPFPIEGVRLFKEWSQKPCWNFWIVNPEIRHAEIFCIGPGRWRGLQMEPHITVAGVFLSVWDANPRNRIYSGLFKFENNNLSTRVLDGLLLSGTESPDGCILIGRHLPPNPGRTPQFVAINFCKEDKGFTDR